jgi:hypothetical protein
MATAPQNQSRLVLFVVNYKWRDSRDRDQVLTADPAKGELQECLIDMQMRPMFGDARVRTKAEFHALLAATGFTPRRTIGTPSPASIIEAIVV